LGEEVGLTKSGLLVTKGGVKSTLEEERFPRTSQSKTNGLSWVSRKVK